MRARMLALSFLLIGSFVLAPSAHAYTNVTGDVVTDTEWTISGSPYIVDVSDGSSEYFLNVATGTTLTIDPGVVVKFGQYDGMAVDGTLRAEGTLDAPIIFTSLEDDAAGGDTNGDGGATAPTDLQWLRLILNTGSNGSFDYATVRYGGGRLWNVFPMTGIENDGGTVIINHTTFAHNGYDGLGQYGGHATLSNSFISDHQVGITVDGGTLEVRGTRIYSNTWHGIGFWSGVLSVTQSEIDHNSIGISINGAGSVTIGDSSIHDNTEDGFSLGIDNGYSDSGVVVDARNTWWGDASGPQNDGANPSGIGDPVTAGVLFDPWLTSDPFAEPPPDPCAEPGACASNVLFLPGIEGSRLYEGTGCGKTSEEKLWEPVDSMAGALFGGGDEKVKKLRLDSSGESSCADIYTKENDILDAVSGSNIYQALIEEMNSLEADGTINDWKPVAYDWRLSLPDLLAKGVERDGKVYYEEATSTPYIEQTLRALAASSKTGKVTIIAHSNGGLVAKALLNGLGDTEAANLVDKIIMVGVPQSGAPASVGSMLVGYDAGVYADAFIFKKVIKIVSNVAGRAFTQDAPMAYHLLPSEGYFSSVAEDGAHPVVHFSGDGYATELSVYGEAITNINELDDFLLARDGGREKPAENNLESAEILNPNLIAYANSTHTTLDQWTPPLGVEVDQIAGWGIDTVAGINFYTVSGASALSSLGPARLYSPIFVEDGDGTVPVPSALMMASSTNVNRYWLNLEKFNREQSLGIKHANLFEIPALEDFLKNILENSTSTLPAYISQSQPPPVTDEKKLIFFLHSPLTLQLEDSSGNVTGLSQDGSVTEDIPGSTYGEFGGVKYLIAPGDSQYTLTMHGQDSGTFSLDMQEASGGVITASSTIANVPTTANTLATLSISSGIETASALTVDTNGDGGEVLTITPKVGETIAYTPPPEPAHSGGAAYAESPLPEPIEATSTQPILEVATTTLPIATTTPPIATTTTEVVATTTATAVAVKATSKRTVARPAPKQKEDISELVTTANSLPDLSQTASVYAASQQPALQRVGLAVYNGLHELWLALMRFL